MRALCARKRQTKISAAAGAERLPPRSLRTEWRAPGQNGPPQQKNRRNVRRHFFRNGKRGPPEAKKSLIFPNKKLTVIGFSAIINLSAYYADRLEPAVKAGAGQIRAKRRTPCPAKTDHYRQVILWRQTIHYGGPRLFTLRSSPQSRTL